MIEDIKKLIKNKINIGKEVNFCAIIGLNPSEGARSPILWNRVFRDFFPKIKMISLDVDQKNLNRLLLTLESYENFLGGAVAAPYKESVYKFLKETEGPTKLIGAVNNLSKVRTNAFYGHNTDGLASLESFKKKFDIKYYKDVLVLGYGGVGKAVSSYFENELDNKISIVTQKDTVILNKLNKNLVFYNWENLDKLIQNHNLIINCTTLGWGSNESLSPLDKSNMSYAKKGTVFYDVIYQPTKTKFLDFASSLGFETMNGEDMNFIQAVLGFKNTIGKFQNCPTVREISNSMLRE